MNYITIVFQKSYNFFLLGIQYIIKFFVFELVIIKSTKTKTYYILVDMKQNTIKIKLIAAIWENIIIEFLNFEQIEAE
jgi:hypothetical protein